MKLKRSKGCSACGLSRLSIKRLLLVIVLFVGLRWYRSSYKRRKSAENIVNSSVATSLVSKAETPTATAVQQSTTTTMASTTTLAPKKQVVETLAKLPVISTQTSSGSGGSNLSAIIPARFIVNINSSQQFPYDKVYDVPDAATFPMAFHFLPREDLCSEEVDLVITIKSTVNHFGQRDVIRNTWGKPIDGPEFKFRIVFLVGVPKNNPDVLMKLKEENDLFEDLAMGSYIDSYKNLTLKTLSGFRWMTSYCSEVEFFMSVDDDVIIDVRQVIGYYKLHQNEDTVSGTIQCGMKIVPSARVTHRGVWSVPYERYNYIRYPPYCLGACYFMTSILAQEIYKASQQTHCDLSVDDALISGVLRTKIRRDIGLMPHNLCRHLTNSNDIQTKILEAWKKYPS